MDEIKPQEFMERPREVLYAFWLIIASLPLELIAIALRSGAVKPQLTVVMILGFLISLTFTLFLFVMILRGRNWARLLYLILFIAGAPFAFPVILAAFQKTPVLASLRLLQLSLQIMAIVLLLQKPARQWFKFIKLRKLMLFQAT